MNVTSLYNICITAALQLRRDSENLALKLQYLNEAHKKMKTDVAITKRVAEKVTADISKAQDEMLRQVSGWLHAVIIIASSYGWKFFIRQSHKLTNCFILPVSTGRS